MKKNNQRVMLSFQAARFSLMNMFQKAPNPSGRTEAVHTTTPSKERTTEKPPPAAARPHLPRFAAHI